MRDLPVGARAVSAPRVAVLRCATLPSFVTWEIPDVPALFSDDNLVCAALAELGAVADPVVWSEPGNRWEDFDLALIRSTWDYIDAGPRFEEVLARVDASSCRLANPLDAVRWNRDKRYLLDLQARGVPVIPTYAALRMEPIALQQLAMSEGWAGAVVKPAVGAGGAGVRRIAVSEIAVTLRDADDPGGLLVQPLAPAVLGEGELSFIFIAGELSHALLKRPAAGDFRAHGIYGGTVERCVPSDADVLEASAIVASLDFDLLYARLDVVRYGDRLAVMELELVEPMLYLGLAEGSAERLASAALDLVS